MKKYNNIILIAGNARNVGKTSFACEIISVLSTKIDLIALKFSPHFHKIDENQKIIASNENFNIIEEQLDTNKDSSRMKKAGAIKSFYIQANDLYTQEAFNILIPQIENMPVICESASLHKFINPALFFVLKAENDAKKNFSDFDYIEIKSEKGKYSYNIKKIKYENSVFSLSN